MRTEVFYRDLPGGPLQIELTDELPLSVFCSKCSMLSKYMFEDPSCHVFCSICIFESSDRKKIHCKYERTEVSVDEMMPAIDVITIVMDQLAYCPNRGGEYACNNFYSLRDLERHYLECERTKIFCLSCADRVNGREWGDHVQSCPQQIVQCRYCVIAVPRCQLEVHQSVCNENYLAIHGNTEGAKKPRDPEMQSKTMAQNHSRHSDQQNENQLKVPASKAAVPLNTRDGLEIRTCLVCNSKVKQINMIKHLKICARRKGCSPTSSALENGNERSQVQSTPEPVLTPALASKGCPESSEDLSGMNRQATSRALALFNEKQIDPGTSGEESNSKSTSPSDVREDSLDAPELAAGGVDVDAIADALKDLSITDSHEDRSLSQHMEAGSASQLCMEEPASTVISNQPLGSQGAQAVGSATPEADIQENGNCSEASGTVAATGGASQVTSLLAWVHSYVASLQWCNGNSGSPLEQGTDSSWRADNESLY